MSDSVDAVKRKIRVLQQQADEAGERAEFLQRQVEEDQTSRGQVGLVQGARATTNPPGYVTVRVGYSCPKGLLVYVFSALKRVIETVPRAVLEQGYQI